MRNGSVSGSGPEEGVGFAELTECAIGVYSEGVEFIETPTFTRLIGKLMNEDEYARLQVALVRRPDWGSIIRASGGIRKLRWAGNGRGKRGGLRIIYYWQTADSQIWMLAAFPKNEKEDLAADEIKVLKRLVEEFES